MIVLWVLWRMSRMLFFRLKDQWEGKEDKLSTLQYDWMFDDYFRDAEDMKSVNFRYNDHKDREPHVSFWTHQVYKPQADRAKATYRYYRHGKETIGDKISKLF